MQKEKFSSQKIQQSSSVENKSNPCLLRLIKAMGIINVCMYVNVTKYLR